MTFFSRADSDTALDTYPDVDPPSCQLLGRTALIVQALMGLFVLLSLIYKRHRETPKRPWRIWLFDVSKQVVGQLFVHGTNLLVSGLVSHHTDGNACVSYFLNILIDTTFGILLLYVTLHVLTHLFTEKLHLKGFESGVYGNPPSLNYWARQAALYILSLTTMKVVVIALLAFVPALYDAGEWLLSWTQTGDGDSLQVVFVMGIFPILMNVLQFWIIDSIVKASAGGAPFLDLERGQYHDEEPLFQTQSEDGDGDDPSLGHHPDAGRRSSLSSSASREIFDHSSATDTPNNDEHKSSGSSSRQVSDVHNYPPSLSSSFSSDASSSHPSKGPREAKNLQKKTKRRDPSTPLSARVKREPPLIASPVSMPATPGSNVATVSHQDHSWTDSWDDPAEWDGEPHQKQALPASSQWPHTKTQTIS